MPGAKAIEYMTIPVFVNQATPPQGISGEDQGTDPRRRLCHTYLAGCVRRVSVLVIKVEPCT